MGGVLPWPTVAALILAAVIGFGVGFAIKGRLDAAEYERLRGEIARSEANHAAERQAAAEASARLLAAAQETERAAVRALHETRTRLIAANRRLKEALYALPTAGNCGLSAGATRLLDDALGNAADVSARAPQPDPAAAESAADAARPAASEAAVGAWIGDAIHAYDECRARIDAIRQWDDVTYGR